MLHESPTDCASLEYTKICLFTEVREFLTNSNPGFRGGVCVMWYKAAQ